jgi:purine-binding chemotaxis protein CheW
MSENGSEAQFVTLGIEHVVFGVPVDIVQEILDMRPVCRMPDAPAHVAGLIDVRGRAVPVIDLRVRLGLPAVAATPGTRILVLDVSVRDRHLALGLIADRVFEVTSLDVGTIGPPPDIGTGWRCEYISGIGRRGDGFVIILDLARLLSSDDVARLSSAPSADNLAA